MSKAGRSSTAVARIRAVLLTAVALTLGLAGPGSAGPGPTAAPGRAGTTTPSRLERAVAGVLTVDTADPAPSPGRGTAYRIAIGGTTIEVSPATTRPGPPSPMSPAGWSTPTRCPGLPSPG